MSSPYGTKHWAEIAKIPRHAALYWYGVQAVSDWLQLHDSARWKRDSAAICAFKKPAFPLIGARCDAKNATSRACFGSLPFKLEHLWVDSHFQLDKDLFAFIRPLFVMDIPFIKLNVGCWKEGARFYGHFTMGGNDIKMASGLPPVISPKRVPRS